MTHAMGSAGLGGADTTVFNEAVSRAPREQGADRAENHHFGQIMTQRLGWDESLVVSWAALEQLCGETRQRGSAPGPSPAHSTAGLPVVSAQQTHPLGQELSWC